jgi:hypothetical protein
MEIIPILFLLSAVITFVVLYFICPKPQVIVKYPKTKDKLSDLYVDDKNVCYRYQTKEVTCPNI